MKTFEITASRTLIACADFATREEALASFKKQHPGWDVIEVNGEIPLAYCEVSGRPIFEGDDYWTDAGGCHFLRSEYSPEQAKEELS